MCFECPKQARPEAFSKLLVGEAFESEARLRRAEREESEVSVLGPAARLVERIRERVQRRPRLRSIGGRADRLRREPPAIEGFGGAATDNPEHETAYDPRMGSCLTIFFTLILAAVSTVQAAPSLEFHRGMVVSCPRWGPIWGSPAMAESLGQLKEIGVDSVAIHPYGWVKRDGTVKFQPASELDFLGRAVELARDVDMRLFWKPHLGYWGEFEWRGAIEFGDDETAWKKFFSEYEAFIVDQARFAAGASVELFAVGVELEATAHRERDWRRIIANVRRVFQGTIVYAANWDRLDRVPFWDAVDWAGVHAYFPLSDQNDPDDEKLTQGWTRVLGDLRAFSEKNDRPILIAEVGYNLNPKAAREPWSYETEDSVQTRELRTRLMEVALDRLAGKRFIRGMYWWKWMPGRSHHRRNFSMRDPEVVRLLAGRWGEPAAVPNGR